MSGASIDNQMLGPYAVRVWGRIGKLLQIVGALTLVFELVGTAKLRGLGQQLIAGARYVDIIGEAREFHERQLNESLHAAGLPMIGNPQSELQLSARGAALSRAFGVVRACQEIAICVLPGYFVLRNASGIVLGITLWLFAAILMMLLPPESARRVGGLVHLPSQFATVRLIGWIDDRMTPTLQSVKWVGKGLRHPHLVTATQWFGLALLILGSLFDLLAS